MSEKQPARLRLCLTALVTLAEVVHLAWEHFHGGITSHHILHRSDMPAISSLWGLILLPALTWFLTSRLQSRKALRCNGKEAASPLPTSVISGFAGSLVFGILLSVSFANGHETLTLYLFQGMLLLALLLPVYRAECVLGFVLGMTFTFGAVIPTVVGSLVAAISALIHLYLRPALLRLWTWLKHW